MSVPAAQESGAISAPEPRVRLINREKPEHMGRENKLTQPASNPPSQTSHGHQPGAKWQQRVSLLSRSDQKIVCGCRGESRCCGFEPARMWGRRLPGSGAGNKRNQVRTLARERSDCECEVTPAGPLAPLIKRRNQRHHGEVVQT